MTSISSEKVPKQEIDAPETISLLKNDSSKVAYECDEPEEEILSDYNVSDDEFTPSKRKRRKEASVRKVDVYHCIISMVFIFSSVEVSLCEIFDLSQLFISKSAEAGTVNSGYSHTECVKEKCDCKWR